MIILGRMTATLYVTSNCTDTDFAVKVIDRYPNGTSLLIQDGILRMRWRNGGAVPQPIVPGSVYQIQVTAKEEERKKERKRKQKRKKKRPGPAKGLLPIEKKLPFLNLILAFVLVFSSFFNLFFALHVAG
jgi:hypothetical protein